MYRDPYNAHRLRSRSVGPTPRRGRAFPGIGTLICLAGTVVIGAAPARAQGGDSAQLSATVGPSIFDVEVDSCSGMLRGGGTAFATGPRELTTNAHVVGNGDPTSLRITARDGRVLIGRVTRWGGDDWDVATIETSEDLNVAPLMFADPATLTEGTPLTVIGYPAGRYTVTSGILNAFESDVAPTRSIGRTDAAVDRGNSGGPALTPDGRVAGIVSAVDLSGITRPGRFITKAGVDEGFRIPESVDPQHCALRAPLARAALRPAALRTKVVAKPGFRVQLPLRLLTRSGVDEDGDLYWDEPGNHLNVEVYELRDDLSAAVAIADINEYYARPGVTILATTSRGRNIDFVIGMRDGSRRRLAYRFRANGRGGMAMVVYYDPPESAMDTIAVKISASFRLT